MDAREEMDRLRALRWDASFPLTPYLIRLIQESYWIRLVEVTSRWR